MHGMTVAFRRIVARVGLERTARRRSDDHHVSLLEQADLQQDVLGDGSTGHRPLKAIARRLLHQHRQRIHRRPPQARQGRLRHRQYHLHVRDHGPGDPDVQSAVRDAQLAQPGGMVVADHQTLSFSSDRLVVPITGGTGRVKSGSSVTSITYNQKSGRQRPDRQDQALAGTVHVGQACARRCVRATAGRPSLAGSAPRARPRRPRSSLWPTFEGIRGTGATRSSATASSAVVLGRPASSRAG